MATLPDVPAEQQAGTVSVIRTIKAGKPSRTWRCSIAEIVQRRLDDGAFSNESHTVATVYKRELAPLFAAAPQLRDALLNLLNGIETGAITSDHDEVFANAVERAREALKAAS